MNNNISYQMVSINVALKMYNSEILESPRVAAIGGNTIY